MSWDEAVAEANEVSPPDAPILKIRAHAADSILGSASFETAAASARRWPFLFEPLLRYGPRAALAASLVGFAGVAAPIFRRSVAVFREDAAARLTRRAATGRRARRDPPNGAPNGRRNPRPQSQGRGGARPKHERKGGHGPRRPQGASRCGEGRNRRRDPELAGKVDRLQRELTTKLAKASERFDRPDHRGAVPRAGATKAPRGDAFDASQNPGAPGTPRPLGSLAPAAKGPVQTF